MSGSYPFSIRSWIDLYQILRAKAEVTRGSITLNPSTGASFPRTTAADAFAIALVFDDAVHNSQSNALITRWTFESDLLMGEPEGSEPYVGNRSLWETLAVVAIELDRAKVTLPPPETIDAALCELNKSPAPAHTRNAAHAPIVTVFSEPTWRAMALRQLEFFRRLRGEVHAPSRTLPPVPATRNADVALLADYWSEQLERLGEDARDTFHRLLYSAWREVVHNVKHAQTAAPSETYERNAEFWSALLLLTTQSDASDEAPTPWVFDAPGMPEPQAARNAQVEDTGATLRFPSTLTWDEQARLQRDAFSRLRGEDTVSGRLIARVPRTTVGDVRQLAAYWSAALIKVGTHGLGDISHRHVVDRWKAAYDDVSRLPRDIDPASVYAHNINFWEAILTIAIQVAVTAEAPTRWDLVKDTIKAIPERLKSGAEGWLWGLLRKPLLFAGVGLGGLVVVTVLLRSSKPASRL